MITPLSRPLWDNLPLLPFTQFPWRFLSVQAFFGALAAGGLALLPGRQVVVPVVVLIIAISGLGDLKTDHLYLTDADITAEQLAEYEWFTGNIGSTVSAEYLPIYVQPRPFTSSWLNDGRRAAVLQSVPGIEAEPISLETDHQRWAISTEEVTEVAMPVMAWPGWAVMVDGSAVESAPAPGSGLISVIVPAGEHIVEVKLGRTPVRTAAEIVSVIALLVLGWLGWPFVRSHANKVNLRWLLVGIVGLVIVSVGLRLWPTPSLEEDTLSWDFEQLGYLHHSPEGIPFEGDLLLRRYAYSMDSAVPGDTFTVTLDWERANGSTAEIALMTPAIQRTSAAPILAVHTMAVDSGEVTYTFEIPENAPAGLYVPRVIVAGAKALTDSGQARGELFLQPVRVLNSSDPTEDENDTLAVRAVDVVYQKANVLQVQLQWLTQEPLTQNYNVSLRLVDANGLVVAQQDAQPGFGYLPSSGWPPGRWENDWLTLPLPEEFSAEHYDDSPYALVVRLYKVETEEVVFIRRIGEMVWEGNSLAFQETPRLLSFPEGWAPPLATYEGIIRLDHYTLEQSADSLDLTIFWHALNDVHENFFHFVHLVDPETGNIVAQHDSMPRNDTYPTSQWHSSEVIADRLWLSLMDVPAGEYRLYAGLYRNQGDSFPPLDGVAGREGRPLDGGRVLLERIVIR
jgi:hypothetical protein